VILLDTHAWVRWLHPEIGRKLPDRLRAWLEVTDAPLAVSVISALEVAQLVKKGVLELPLPMPEWFDEALAGSTLAARETTGHRGCFSCPFRGSEGKMAENHCAKAKIGGSSPTWPYSGHGRAPRLGV